MSDTAPMHCSQRMEPCFNAAAGMKLRAWLCVHCGWTEPAILEERTITQGEWEQMQEGEG